MTQASVHISTLLRLLALCASLALAGTARADEYSEVSQLLRSGKLAEAQARVDQNLARKPRDPQMRYLRGMVQNASGQSADAIATFTKLTEDFPELAEPYNSLAVIHAAQGDYEKARVALESAIRANPAYATAHENLGDLYMRMAARAYGQAMQGQTDNTALKAKLATAQGECR